MVDTVELATAADGEMMEMFCCRKKPSAPSTVRTTVTSQSPTLATEYR